MAKLGSPATHDWQSVGGNSSDEDDWEMVSSPLADLDNNSDSEDSIVTLEPEPELEVCERVEEVSSENAESMEKESALKPEEKSCPRYYPIETTTHPATYCAHIFTLFSVSVVLCQTLERTVVPSASPTVQDYATTPSLRHSYVVHGSNLDTAPIFRPVYTEESTFDESFAFKEPIFTNMTDFPSSFTPEVYDSAPSAEQLEDNSMSIEVKPFLPSQVEVFPTDIVITYDPAAPLEPLKPEPTRQLYNVAESLKPICFDSCYSTCEDQCEIDCLGNAAVSKTSQVLRPEVHDERSRFCLSSCSQSCLPTCRESCHQSAPHTTTVIALNNAACGSQCRALCTWSSESCDALCDGWCEQ